jgi:AraC family transcriptional regulator
MQVVAQTINLCPSYAARKLRAQTGFGFLAHLHRRRIAVARSLLVETSLSIKEIAATVGYAHQSDLSRHFKLAGGDSPVVFRAMSIDHRRHSA